MDKLIPLFFCLSLVFGQDTTNTIRHKLHIDMAAQGYYQNGVGYDEVRMPDYLRSTRPIHHSPTHITDNPLLHGAYFFDVDAELELAKGFDFHANLIGEHRGFSYGVYDTDNMILYPKAKVVIDQALNVFSKKTRFFLSLGNKTDLSIYEGLTLYNLDAQGWEVFLQWGKLRFTRVHISDADRWIGLNIGDTFDHFFSIEGLTLSQKWKSDLRAGWYTYNDDGLKFSTGFYKNHNLRIYAQGGYRLSGEASDFNRTSAGLLGVKFRRERDKWSLHSTLEIRRYGAAFNDGYKNARVSYRGLPEKIVWSGSDVLESPYGNTIGQNLYPLSLYDRPFSQWSVFTEYQGKHVGAVIFQLHGKYHLYKSLMCRISLDMNEVIAQGEEPFMYPFYRLGIGWEPMKNNYFMMGISNKGMNLDAHYPTFYLYKYPTFHLEMKRVL